MGLTDVIRKEAWSFHRTISGVRLCWVLEESEGLEGFGVWDWGLGVGIWGLGLGRALGLGFKVWGLEIRVSSLGTGGWS